MNLNLVSEVWDLLNYYIDTNDRSAAATSLVDLLVDNNYSAEEIKSAFKGEKDVIKALEAYDDDLSDEYDDEDDDYLYDEDESDNDW